MKRYKVTVVGAGKVGSTTAQWLLSKGLSDVVLLDVVEGLPQGTALDQWEAASILGFSVRSAGDQDYDTVEGSDIVVITAGKARTPGMSRDDLLQINARIVSGVAAECARRAPEAIYVVVTNPLDVMAYVVMKTTGAEPQRVVGMAGVLDTSRFKTFVAEALNVSPVDVSALVLGGHGDAMVPLVRTATVGGVPLTDLLSPEKIEALVERTRNGGAEIVAHLRTGSAYTAPAAAVAQMVESVLMDQKRLLPCAAWLTGQFGLKDVFVGVPVVLGCEGVERIVEIPLTDEEQRALATSAENVKAVMDKLPSGP